MEKSIELVVAHYNENLNWLRRVPATIKQTIYSKAENPPGILHIPLPNIGREANTYLHHLVSRFNSMADYTIFCQGKPFDHAYDFHATLRTLASDKLPSEPFTWLGHIIDTDTSDGGLFSEWSKNETHEGLNLDGFHQKLMDSPGPTTYSFHLGAQWIVKRELVQEQPNTFYKKALDLTTSFPNAAHCYERMWDRVFGVEGISKEWLGARQTVYLKQIKRLME